MVKAKQFKRNLFFSGLTTTGLTWGVVAYWTLVSNGFLNSPWVV